MNLLLCDFCAHLRSTLCLFFFALWLQKKKSFTDSTFSSLSFCGLFLLGFICKHTHTPKETKLPLKKRKRIEQKKQSTETKRKTISLLVSVLSHQRNEFIPSLSQCAARVLKRKKLETTRTFGCRNQSSSRLIEAHDYLDVFIIIIIIIIVKKKVLYR